MTREGNSLFVDVVFDGNELVDAFEIKEMLTLRLTQNGPSLQVRQDFNGPIPALARPIEQLLSATIAGVTIPRSPKLQSGQLAVPLLYRPSGFPFAIEGTLEIEQDLTLPRLRIDAKAGVEAAINAGLRSLVDQLNESGLPGVGHVRVERESVQLTNCPVGFELNANLGFIVGEALEIPIAIRVHPESGLSIRVDERGVVASLGKIVTAELGELLPLGFQFDDPPFTLDGGLRLYFRFYADIPVFGSSLGGRMQVSSDGVHLAGAIEVGIPGWIESPPVAFGRLRARLDLRESTVALVGRVAISPGEATQHVLMCDLTGELQLGAPVVVRARGDVMLASLFPINESEVVLIPEDGSFRITSHWRLPGLTLDGRLGIELLDRNRVDVAGRLAHVYAIADLTLLGAELADINVGFTWEIALWGSAQLDLPIGRVNAEVAFDERLSNPSLRFTAALADADGLAGIAVDVAASEEMVAADASARFAGVGIAVFLEFPGLYDLTPDAIVAALLDLINLGLQPPSGFDLVVAPETPDVDGEEGRAQRGRPPEVAVEVEQPDDVSDASDLPWRPGWRVEIEEIEVLEGGDSGFLGTGLWGKSPRKVKVQREKVLVVNELSWLPFDGIRLRTDKVYFKEFRGFTALHWGHGRVELYESRVPVVVWSGTAPRDSKPPVKFYFAKGGIAVLKHFSDRQITLALARGEDVSASIRGFPVDPILGCPIGDGRHPMSLTENTIDGELIANLLESSHEASEKEQDISNSRIWQFAVVKRWNVGLEAMHSIGAANSGCAYFITGGDNFLFLTDASDRPLILTDLTVGDHSSVSHRNSIASNLDALRALPGGGGDPRPPGVGALLAPTTDAWSRALIGIGFGGQSGEAFLIGDGEPLGPAGQWKTYAAGQGIRGLSQSMRSDKRVADELIDVFSAARPSERIDVSVLSKAGTHRAAVVYAASTGGENRVAFIDPATPPPGGTPGDRWDSTWKAVKSHWDDHRFFLPNGLATDFFDSSTRFVDLIVTDRWMNDGWRANPIGSLRP